MIFAAKIRHLIKDFVLKLIAFIIIIKFKGKFSNFLKNL